jgi:hypothetical protein
MFIHFYTHDISIFALNCNIISLSIKRHRNFICVNEWLCIMKKLCVHINIIFNIKIKFKEILKYEFVIIYLQYMH